MPKLKMRVHLVANLGRALYDSIGIKIASHLSVWSASLLECYIRISFVMPSISLYGSLGTNSFGLIARNYYIHCRFLYSRLWWFSSLHITEEESWKSQSKHSSLIIIFFRKICKSILMSNWERKPGQTSQGTAIRVKFFPECAVRKRTSFYSYLENHHKRVSHCSVTLMRLILKPLLFWRKRKCVIGCQGKAWCSGSRLGKKIDWSV